MFSRHRRNAIKRNKGAAIAEGAAALTILLPVAITVIFVALEASYAYTIKSSLAEGAREAARDLAIAYGLDSSIAASRDTQDTKVFDNIRITNIINDSAQFDDPTFNTGSDPATVKVVVRYLSGQYGLPVFPNPDPLNLGSTFQITAVATYRLQ